MVSIESPNCRPSRVRPLRFAGPTLAFTLLFVLAGSLEAAEGKLSGSAAISPAKAAPGETVSVQLDLSVESGWVIYDPACKDGSTPTRVTVESDVLEAGELRFPEPKSKESVLSEEHPTLYHQGKFRASWPHEVKAATAPGSYRITTKVRYVACSDSIGICDRPRTLELESTLVVAAKNGGEEKAVSPPVESTAAETTADETKREARGTASDDPGLESLDVEPIGGAAKGEEKDPLAGLLEEGLGKGDDEPKKKVEKASFETLWSHDAARPGDKVILGIRVQLAEKWHINADDAQITSDFQSPTKVEPAEADDRLTFETARFLEPKLVSFEYAEKPLAVYEDETKFFLPVKVSEAAEPGEAKIEVAVRYQACDDKYCDLPVKVTLSESLRIVGADTAVAPIHEEFFADYPEIQAPAGAVCFDLFGWEFCIDASSGAGLLLLLLVAALGGALLNFTPCVLPVVPLKIMSLSAAAGNRGRCFTLGFSMSLGVVAFWLGLGGLIAGVSGFTATNQLFQYPAFTIGVGVVIAIMAVGMCGFFSVGLPAFLQRINPSHDTLAGSFGFGIMTAVLSTPCTAPFMGAAAAWAATQSPGTTLTTFSSIGAGMALPYLILSAAPGLARSMPRSGAASELIKQVMGLLLLAAAAYFVGVGLSALLKSPSDPASLTYWWAVMGFSGAAGAWLTYRTLQITRSGGRRFVFGGLGILILAVSIFGAARLTDEGPIDWIYYTPERFETALKEGKVIVEDYTAEWCLNCKALEQTVLHSDKVVQLLSREWVAPIKVDLTGENPDAKAKLEKTGRLTIPLLVVYAPENPRGRVVFMSDAYTPGQVIEAIHEARGKVASADRAAED